MNNADFLSEIELFQELPRDLWHLVVELFEEVGFADDEIVFQVDDPSEHVYVVRSGAVLLYSDRAGEAHDVKARVPVAGVFGEVGVLQGSGRTLSARAEGDTTLLRLRGASLLELARGYDALALRLSKIALQYSFQNQASRAELARRREARIRVGAVVDMRVEGRESVPVVLENLSLGGACLSGLPSEWSLEEGSLMSLAVDPRTTLLNFYCRQAWRQQDRIGLAFTERLPDHEMRVAGTLHRLTGTALPTN